jgi:hypothetical protein
MLCLVRKLVVANFLSGIELASVGTETALSLVNDHRKSTLFLRPQITRVTNSNHFVGA